MWGVREPEASITTRACNVVPDPQLTWVIAPSHLHPFGRVLMPDHAVSPLQPVTLQCRPIEQAVVDAVGMARDPEPLSRLRRSN